jgi:hypothetical protein
MEVVMDGDVKVVEAKPDPTHFPAMARRLVFNKIAERIAQTDLHIKFAEDNVYVVWFAYTLGNWKALCASTLPDGRYYEVTFSAVKQEAYVDTYIKLENTVVPMTEIKA